MFYILVTCIGSSIQSIVCWLCHETSLKQADCEMTFYHKYCPSTLPSYNLETKKQDLFFNIYLNIPMGSEVPKPLLPHKEFHHFQSVTFSSLSLSHGQVNIGEHVLFLIPENTNTYIHTSFPPQILKSILPHFVQPNLEWISFKYSTWILINLWCKMC